MTLMARQRTVADPSRIDTADWLQRLRKIVEQKLKRIHFGEVDKEFGDTLLNFMMSADGYYFSDNPGAGDYNFLAKHTRATQSHYLRYFRRILSVLDISELIAGGWTNAFDDLVEFKQDFTTFYGIFKASLEDISALTQIAPDNKTLARMLYAAVISAMETYLSDTLRKQVFVKPAIKRRFVEAHGKFKGNHLDLSDIYTWLEKLDSFITDVIDSRELPQYRKRQQAVQECAADRYSKATHGQAGEGHRNTP